MSRANKAGAYVAHGAGARHDGPAIQAGAPYDLVFANILLPPLKRLAAPIGRCWRPAPP